MTARISDFDHFSMVVNMFLPLPFIVALILQLNSTLTKLPFTSYRMEIGGTGLELWPFLPFVG